MSDDEKPQTEIKVANTCESCGCVIIEGETGAPQICEECWYDEGD